jgi:hypothetical protein
VSTICVRFEPLAWVEPVLVVTAQPIGGAGWVELKLYARKDEFVVYDVIV